MKASNFQNPIYHEYYKSIMNVVNSNRKVSERINELELRGFKVCEKAMGSGGVGQIKYLKDCIRVQISCGHGRCNYAYCVEL